MTDLIRSACLTHYPELARSVGIDPEAMLRRVRLPLGCLAHQNMRIAVTKVRRLLEVTATTAGVDEFGLRMAERGGLSNLGPVALIIRDQPTVGAALESLSRYIHIHHEGMRLAIELTAISLSSFSSCAVAARACPVNRSRWRSARCIAWSSRCSAAPGARWKFT